MTESEQAQAFWRTWSRLVARSWMDRGFKQRLISEPEVVLAEAGFPVPAEITVRVVEHDPDEAVLPLPSRPPQELTEEDLDHVAGGTGGPHETQAEQRVFDLTEWWSRS